MFKDPKLNESLKSAKKEFRRRFRVNYSEYILSKAWEFKKKEFFASKYFDGKCFCCGAEGLLLNVHHKTYGNLGKEKLSDLVALCIECQMRRKRKGIYSSVQ